MDIQDGWIPVTYKKKSPNKIGTILKNEQVCLKFRSNRIQTDKITTTKVSNCQPKTKSPVENEVIKLTRGSENPALSGELVGNHLSLESELKKILGMESTETNKETNSEGEDDPDLEEKLRKTSVKSARTFYGESPSHRRICDYEANLNVHGDLGYEDIESLNRKKSATSGITGKRLGKLKNDDDYVVGS